MVESRIEYHPAARMEVFEALDWYRNRSLSAASQFEVELAKAHRSILQWPDLWAEYLYGNRRFLIRRFSIVVVYRVSGADIEIIAIAHGRRKPGYWAERLKKPS